MRIIQWLLGMFMFLFICTMFIQFGNSILSTLLLISLATLGIKFLLEQNIRHY